MKDLTQSLRGRTPGALLLILAVTMLTACNGTSLPKVIATYPHSEHPRSERPPSYPPSNAQLELAVKDAGLAARQVLVTSWSSSSRPCFPP